MSARIGWVNYSSCLYVGVSPSGLSLRNHFFLSRDDELLIPWSDLKLLSRGWLGLSVLLFVKRPRMKIRIGCGLFHGLKIIRAIEQQLSRGRS
ncbi:MAG: hypothetical protein ACTHOU_20480 [Aureliella sp.]